MNRPDDYDIYINEGQIAESSHMYDNYSKVELYLPDLFGYKYIGEYRTPKPFELYLNEAGRVALAGDGYTFQAPIIVKG